MVVQALSLAEQERSALQEKLSMTQRDVEEAELNFERQKRDFFSRMEHQQSTIEQLKSELNNSKVNLNEATYVFHDRVLPSLQLWFHCCDQVWIFLADCTTIGNNYPTKTSEPFEPVESYGLRSCNVEEHVYDDVRYNQCRYLLYIITNVLFCFAIVLLLSE